MNYCTIKAKAEGKYAGCKCKWCGEAIKDGESFLLIIPTFEYKQKYEKLANNVEIHQHEFDEILTNFSEQQEKILDALGNHTIKIVSK